MFEVTNIKTNKRSEQEPTLNQINMEHRIHTMPHDAFVHVCNQIATTKANKAKRLGLAIETREDIRIAEYELDHSQVYYSRKNANLIRIEHEEDIRSCSRQYGSADRIDKYGKAYYDGSENTRNGKQLLLKVVAPDNTESVCLVTREQFIQGIEEGRLVPVLPRHYQIRERIAFMDEMHKVTEECINSVIEKPAEKPHGPVDFHDALAGILDNMLNEQVEFTDYDE